METLLTEAGPDATAEFQDEIALALKELGTDVVEGNVLEANVLDRWVLVRVMALPQLARKQGIARRQRADDNSAGVQVAQCRGRRQGAGKQRLADDAHFFFSFRFLFFQLGQLGEAPPGRDEG